MVKLKTNAYSKLSKLEQEQKAFLKKKQLAAPEKFEMGECEVCGMNTLLVPEVCLCGPCCFGEADTLNGNW